LHAIAATVQVQQQEKTSKPNSRCPIIRNLVSAVWLAVYKNFDTLSAEATEIPE